MEPTKTPPPSRHWLDPQRLTAAQVSPKFHAWILAAATGRPPHHCQVCRTELVPPTKVFCSRDHTASASRSVTHVFGRMPAAYRETELEMLPDRDAAIIAMAFKWEKPLLILAGGTGAGKTRCAWALAYLNALAGRLGPRTFAFYRGHEIGRRIVESTRPGRDEEAEPLETWLDPFRDEDCAQTLLIIDELDKIKWTPRVATEVFELIEARTAHQAQTILTCNSSLDAICAGLPENIGPAMERRLAEFSRPILFMNPAEQTAIGHPAWNAAPPPALEEDTPNP